MFPLGTVRMLARGCAGILFTLLPIRKRVTINQLHRAFPDEPEEWIRVTARESYINLVTTIFELMWTPRLTPEIMKQQYHIHRVDILQRAIKRGYGVVIISGHVGNWEWMAVCVGYLLDLSLMIIVHPLHNPGVNKLVEELRTQFGNRNVPLANAIRPVLTELRNRGTVAMLADQSGPSGSIYPDFFGRPAATYEGPAYFALKCQSSVIMTYNIRRPDGSYDLFFDELPAADLTDASKESIEELTRRHVDALETIIRKQPGIWLWQHKRWKHAPRNGLS
jgi:Kdo2-lipid IVA lauroyltransferase/acyltransferase